MEPSPDAAPESLEPLLLLGTIHGDPEGRERLLAFLGLYRPDFLFVEFSPFGLAYRMRAGAGLIRRLDRNLKRAARRIGIPLSTARLNPRIRAIRTQFALPFEYVAASRYARPRRVPLILLDSSRFSRRLIASWPDLIRAENLAILLTLPPPRPMAALRAEAALAMEGRLDPVLPATDHGDTDPSWKEREHHLAERIRFTLSRRRPSRPLAIGGYRHLIPGLSPPTLRDLLGVPSERCRLLVGPFA